MSALKTRILHVEDEPLDSELVGLWLHEGGLDSDIVPERGYANWLWLPTAFAIGLIAWSKSRRTG